METELGLSDFTTAYVGTIAALLTVFASSIAFSRWIRGIWAKRFLAKPVGEVVDAPFNYHDVHAGMSALVADAERFNPDVIVGINRGGAIVGGILGKHLGLFVHVMEVREGESPRLDHAPNMLKDKSVLVVDDRLSRGTHMDAAYRFLNCHAKDLRKVVFVWIEQPMSKQAPDSFAYRAKTPTIPLPWEPGQSRQWR